MKIVGLVNKYDIKEIVLALIFIFPYIQVTAVKKIFEYHNETVFIPANLVIEMIILILLIISAMIKKHTIINNQRIGDIKRFALIFILYCLITGIIRVLLGGSWALLFSQLSYLAIPLILAIICFEIILNNNLCLLNIIRIGLVFFWLYAIICFVYNLKIFSFDIGQRLYSPGGGAVIFGYTIAVMMLVMLMTRNKHTFMWQIVFMCTMLICTLLTGSRGAVWPALLIFCIYVFILKNKIAKTILVFATLAFIILINPIEIIQELLPRLFITQDTAREDTWVVAINAFFHQGALDCILGKGMGQFFPYQAWCLADTSSSMFHNYNHFFYQGEYILVQPHNTYVYLLLETGICGIAIFAIFALRSIKNKNRINTFLILFILLENCFDSVFIVEPGSAFLWWTIYFIAMFYEDNTIIPREVDDNEYTKRLFV